MFKAKKHIVWRKKKKLIVLLNTQSGSYFTLNKTGQDLWMSHIVEGQPLEEVAQNIAKKYANPPAVENIVSDCKKLIADWDANELIEEMKETNQA